MRWSIPAKTFLVGEYAALHAYPAIVLTTHPCFELSINSKAGLINIHPLSPAGLLWNEYGAKNYGLKFTDPYNGRGGMGASSAQFLGAYYAIMYLENKSVYRSRLLASYIKYATHQQGIAPSGYDVLAQSMNACVYINQAKLHYQTYDWPFTDLNFILLHSKQKLATHQHLCDLILPPKLKNLASIVEHAHLAFTQCDSHALIAAVNNYHTELVALNLVAAHSLAHIEDLKGQNDILAIKGCGALGADVLLLLVASANHVDICKRLARTGWDILASTANLSKKST